MAEEYDERRTHECEEPVVREGRVEAKDRGVFDFMGEKRHDRENKLKEEVIAAEFEENVNVYDEVKPKEDEEEKHGLLEKLHRSHSSSSSSSDEEEDEEKKKKRKEKKKREKEEKKGEEKEEEMIEDTAVPVEKFDEVVAAPPPAAEEKKGFLEKIKEKIPAVGEHTKKAEEVTPPPPPPSDVSATALEAPPPCNDGEAEGKEKKGLLEKIKEKLPGYHPKGQED